jgi:hypothetical protein
LSRGEWVEVVAAAALVVAALHYLWWALRAAATLSLWNDEIFSILKYSGRGPRTTLTVYDAANNHVFFNLLNSLTPGAGSFDPLHARLWSIVAVLATIGLVLYETCRRRWFLAGGLFVFLLCIDHGYLELALQARGYGILGFCAVASAFWTLRFVETRRRRWLAALGVVTLVGIWTIPTFVAYAAALWLALLFIDRSAKVLRYGIAAAVASVVVYLPVQGQMREQFSNYASIFGKEYAHPSAVWSTFQQYFFDHIPAVTVVLVLVGLAGAVAAVFRRRLGVPRTTALASAALIFSAVSFFAACLVLQTPAVRTTAFVTWPLALGLLIPAADLYSRVDGVAWRSIVSISAAGFLVVPGWTYARSHPFVPQEDWKGAAGYIADTFPDGTLVLSGSTPGNLDAYLSPRDLGTEKFAPLELLGGHLVLVDERTLPAADASEQFVAQESSKLVEQDLVQQRGHYPAHTMRVIFGLPRDDQIAAATVDGRDAPELIDRDLSTSTPHASSIVLTLDPGTVGRSLILVPSGGYSFRALRMKLVSPSGAVTVLHPRDLVRSVRLLTVPLGDRPISRIEITDARSASWREAWVYSP